MDSQQEDRAPSMLCMVSERAEEPSAHALSTYGARPGR